MLSTITVVRKAAPNTFLLIIQLHAADPVCGICDAARLLWLVHWHRTFQWQPKCTVKVRRPLEKLSTAQVPGLSSLRVFQRALQQLVHRNAVPVQQLMRLEAAT